MINWPQKRLPRPHEELSHVQLSTWLLLSFWSDSAEAHDVEALHPGPSWEFLGPVLQLPRAQLGEAAGVGHEEQVVVVLPGLEEARYSPRMDLGFGTSIWAETLAKIEQARASVETKQ